MDIWTLKEAEARRAALGRLGESLLKARARYETVKERNDRLLAEVSEEAPA